MFCPQCQAEYRPGFSRCSDCDVDLVHEVPEARPSDSPSKGNLALLWIGDDLALHAELLEELKTASIPYLDRPINSNTRRAFREQLPLVGGPPFGFEVAVFFSDLKMAKAILEKLESGTGNPGESQDER